MLVERIKIVQKELSALKLPKSIRLNNFTYLNDTKLFANTHLAYCKKYYKNKQFTEPYLERLELLVSVLKDKK